MRPHWKFWPLRLPKSITLPETTLVFNLDVTATRYPNKDAIRFFGAGLTYAELKRQVDALAGWLQRVANVARGDRVLLYVQNSPQHVVATYAILRAEAVVVPVNPMNRAEELRHYITDSGARVVICAADLAGMVAQANAELGADEQVRQILVTRYTDAMPPRGQLDPEEAPPAAWSAWLEADPPLPAGATRWTDAMAAAHAPLPTQAGPDDLAVMPYTSGTTGFPKGCMHTHRTIMHNVIGGALMATAGADATVLGVVPLFHVTGMLYGMHTPIFGGSTVVMMPRWERELAGRLISRHRVTHWTNIPTMIIDMFGSPNLEKFDLSSLRNLSGGGAAMPQAVAERLQKQFGITYAEGYGLTETAAPSHTNPPERAKLQCLGMPIYGTDARVVDPTTLKELPPNEVGEIIVNGPQVFKGYWRNPAATAAAFIEFEGKTFFRTGDLGRMDEEGYFFLTDRLKRMINASGFKVWPAEVENLLYKHPAIQEACIIASRDAYRGETVKAVVVLRAEAKGRTSVGDIIGWAREHMAAYKVPRLVEFVDELPKSGTGKVMWRALQEREAAREAAPKQ
ncbi:MAG TPA: long-chain fatty acid--CoA ligase [Burkholderiaceae bacterium]|nr:long-chain fatty acid--CoA ligase [Burkholderiaceae bacterium]